MEPCGLTQDMRDLVIAVDIGRAPSPALGQEGRRRDLSARIRCAQPSGEAANVAQTLCPGGGADAARCRRPTECKLSRDHAHALAFEELHEVMEASTRVTQLGAKRAAQREVCLEAVAERVHRPPLTTGQGMATPRRAPNSTFA